MSSLIDTETLFKSIAYIKVLFDTEIYLLAYIDFVKVQRMKENEMKEEMSNETRLHSLHTLFCLIFLP